jgi:chromosome segregation ATPase
MSQEITQDFHGNRRFEERVFARFDGVDSYLRSLDARVQVLESRSYDTKPIWERALKEILETRHELSETRSEVAGVKSEVAGVKAEVGGVKREVEGLKGEVAGAKSEVAGVKSEVTGVKSEVVEIKRELKEFKREVTKRLDQVQSIQLSNRVDIREAEERIERLESRMT